MAEMTFSANGMALVQEFESLQLKAYKDPVGILTIGYGHTGRDVKPGMVITQEQAKALLISDLQIAVTVVSKSVKVPVNQNQFDALVDFAFNVGSGAFVTSTLLKKLNAGDLAGASSQFGLWVHANGAQVPGLVRRRSAEANLFIKPV